ncbi:MAG: transcription termination factor NusA [Patescibacteria group bacterium]
MAITEFNSALNQVATERGISVDSVLETIKLALISAYKKDYGDDEDEVEGEVEESIEVDLNPDTGEARILKEGKDITPSGFGRIAAQTAKQVILQKIRETEKEVILDEFKSKVGTLIRGTIFRIENGVVILDLGRAHGILPQSEQVPSEDYKLNQRLRVLIKDIRKSNRGTEIIVSRTDTDFIVKLFEQEVPEIASGVVTIEAIAREPGSRTKMAVSSSDDKIDPVGSCVGQKGVRVQAIITEIFGEKIDIVPYSPIIEKFIAASLSPAKVTEVDADLENKEAHVSVPEDQLSLAIGKEGQNVRLAHKLTKWKIDIKGAPSLFGSIDSTLEVQEDDDTVVRGVWDEDIKAKEDEVESESLEDEVSDTATSAEEEDIASEDSNPENENA